MGKDSADNPAVGAVNPTNWVVLVRSEGTSATGFIEIRQNGSAVWTARGAPYTPGEQKLTEFQTMEKAEAFVRQAIADSEAEGFRVLHSASSVPGTLDFDLLEDAIHDGAREAYRAMCDEHPQEILTGFALFTDFDGMTLCPAAMAEKSFDDLDASDEELDYYRTNPSEWPYTSDAGLLLAYRIILVAAFENDAIPFETEIPDYFERFSETCVRALERLDRSSLFGSGADRENFLLLFGVSDGGPTKAAVERLNPDTVYQRYARCFDD